MGSVFDRPGKSDETTVDTQELFAQIGKLKVENEFLKKSFKRLGRQRIGLLWSVPESARSPFGAPVNYSV